MHTFVGNNPSQLYTELVAGVMTRGRMISPRGMPTDELSQVMTSITEPMKRLVLVPRRNLNPFFLVAESMWIMGGRADAEFILYYNSKLKQFLDPECPQYFHGAYGERIRNHNRSLKRRSMGHPVSDYTCDQLGSVVNRLLEDRDSRRAVITLWNPCWDNGESNDIPCNDMVFFKIRDGKLCATVINRSNDLNLGFPSTNVFQFSVFQEVVARLVDVDVGEYVHFSDSLHIYQDDPITDRVMLELPYPFQHQQN